MSASIMHCNIVTKMFNFPRKYEEVCGWCLLLLPGLRARKHSRVSIFVVFLMLFGLFVCFWLFICLFIGFCLFVLRGRGGEGEGEGHGGALVLRLKRRVIADSCMRCYLSEMRP